MARCIRSEIAVALLSAVSIGLGGCGGGQEKPAESPEPAAMPDAPAGAEGAAEGDGQHTMPDGTTMPGDQHGDHGGDSPPAPAGGDPPAQQ
jgi:hypothetical protein